MNTTGLGPTRHWIGGGVAAAARALAWTWSSPAPVEATIAKATEDFLRLAIDERGSTRPVWLNRVAQRLQSDAPPTTRELARELRMHAGWLAEAYRAATGEGSSTAASHADTIRRLSRRSSLLFSPTLQLLDGAPV